MAGLSHLRIAAPAPTLRRLGFLARRLYASAAAAELYDYDYDEDDESEVLRRKLAPMVDTAGLESARGVKWVLIGDPGAKKHVYAEMLSKLLEVPRISMASLVRQELNPHSSIYRKIANAVNEGKKLVPEEIIFGLLSKRLEEGYCRGETGFILDGIPRTRIQAEILDQIVDIDLVVNFKCTEEQLGKKNLGMGTFSPLHTTIDTDTWKEKFRIYAEQNKPLEDYYRKQKKLLDFQVASAPGETWLGLLVALHLQHMKLTASFV